MGVWFPLLFVMAGGGRDGLGMHQLAFGVCMHLQILLTFTSIFNILHLCSPYIIFLLNLTFFHLIMYYLSYSYEKLKFYVNNIERYLDITIQT